MGVLAIARQRFPQIGEPCISPVVIDEARKAYGAMPIAAMAFDVEHLELADKLGQGDGSATAHSRKPKPVSLSTSEISQSCSISFRARTFPCRIAADHAALAEPGLIPAWATESKKRLRTVAIVNARACLGDETNIGHWSQPRYSPVVPE
jgi:hypothetical protein